MFVAAVYQKEQDRREGGQDGRECKTGSDEIWLVYGPQTGVVDTATVGVENQYGSAGDLYYYNGSGTAPTEGTSLKAVTAVDQAVFTYELSVGPIIGIDVRNVASATNDNTGRVLQAATTVQVGERIYLPVMTR